MDEDQLSVLGTLGKDLFAVVALFGVGLHRKRKIASRRACSDTMPAGTIAVTSGCFANNKGGATGSEWGGLVFRRWGHWQCAIW